MRIEEKKNLLLSDTVVSDLFISEYMTGLTSCAIQCYLYVLMACKNKRTLNEKDLAARLSTEIDEVKGSLTQLVLAGLIEWNDKEGIGIVDLKSLEVDGYIKRMQDSSEKVAARPISPEDERRDNLATSVAKTFFHGSMGYKWYREIDILLDDFAFDTQVVYKLFQICSDRKQLSTMVPLKEMAVRWHAKNIHDMQELSQFLDVESLISLTMRKLGNRLRKKLTEYDEEYIRIWVEKLRYPYEVIDFAVRKMSQMEHPSMKLADDFLKTWFASGIKNIQEAEKFEEERAIRNKLAYNKNKDASATEHKGVGKQNFAGVSYTDEQMRAFEADPNELLERLNAKRMQGKEES